MYQVFYSVNFSAQCRGRETLISTNKRMQQWACKAGGGVSAGAAHWWRTCEDEAADFTFCDLFLFVWNELTDGTFKNWSQPDGACGVKHWFFGASVIKRYCGEGGESLYHKHTFWLTCCSCVLSPGAVSSLWCLFSASCSEHFTSYTKWSLWVSPAQPVTVSDDKTF